MEFYKLSQYKSTASSQGQLDDLSFCKHAVSRSEGKLSEVRKKSGKSQGK